MSREQHEALDELLRKRPWISAGRWPSSEWSSRR